MPHVLFPPDILELLAANGRASREAQRAGADEPDHHPVVKIFNPYGGATWLLTESEPDDPDILFGLCDIGFGTPELGNVRRSEIETLRFDLRRIDSGPGRLKVVLVPSATGLSLERDLHFRPTKPLSQYATEAGKAGRIAA